MAGISVSKGHGNFGVEIIEKKNPKVKITYWCNDKKGQMAMLQTVATDPAVKSKKLVTRKFKGRGIME